MVVRAPVAPGVVAWALDRSGLNVDDLTPTMPRLASWLRGDIDDSPTFAQVQELARKTGIPLGYLFLEDPPTLRLPVSDFRDGYAGRPEEPSVDLLAVIHQSQRRQDWYREYAEAWGLPAVEEVGRGRGMTAEEAGADMRARLRFEVNQRQVRSDANRKMLLGAFEDLGGLTVATSMVGNNTHRLLDPEEFRGFTLSDPLAPLIFINTRQTLNAQLFTIAHEIGHVWRGDTGVSAEEPTLEAGSQAERWCNAAASEFLVPARDLVDRYPTVAGMPLTEQIEQLASVYRCGTLVVLQAIKRQGLMSLPDFDAVYRAELDRLTDLASTVTGGGDYWRSQPYRIGDRLGRAIVSDVRAGNMPVGDAISLTGLGSLSGYQEYERRIGA